MRALAFWKAITVDQANFLERLLAILKERGIRYCLIGGQEVNAYVEPVVSLDLDIVVAADQVALLESLLAKEFHLKRFRNRLNVSLTGSDLRVQIQTDPRYAEFIDRASRREILGLTLPVPGIEDVLRGKVWAAQDPDRRASKRQKDLADISRIIEAYPRLRSQVPGDVLSRLIGG